MYDVRAKGRDYTNCLYDICTVFFRFKYVFETYHSN